MIAPLYFSQLEKQYKNYLKTIVADQPFESLVLRGGKDKPVTTVQLHQQVKLFREYEKTASRPGWQIEWGNWNSKKLGKQQWPENIIVPTEEDYLYLLQKQTEVQQFKQQLRTLLQWRADIQPFLYERPQAVLELRDAWKGICAVTDYLAMHDVQQYYIRSIPVPVHTKFIQQHQFTLFALLKLVAPQRLLHQQPDLERALGLQQKPVLHTVRWLDAALAGSYTNGLEVLGITTADLQQVNWQVNANWLVENETNLYLLPPQAGTLAIFSKGYALEQLRAIPLLQQHPLYYWGDLDEDGFVMLHQMRQYYPHLQSVCMDLETVQLHLPEMDRQPVPYRKRLLSALTPSEQAAFDCLAQTNGRIEQEKLQQAYVGQQVKKVALSR